MGGRELGEDLERLEVEPRRVLDEALLPLDVGQVVQRVGVRRGQPVFGIKQRRKFVNVFVMTKCSSGVVFMLL